ncbi:MAG: hypothetical protein AVDCRST_MAG75-1541, partial [uncultured Propionibacteriaceae bacterium]
WSCGVPCAAARFVRPTVDWRVRSVTRLLRMTCESRPTLASQKRCGWRSRRSTARHKSSVCSVAAPITDSQTMRRARRRCCRTSHAATPATSTP